MRLKTIRLDGYRHFLGQRLDLDPIVTAVVGRNDAGKTGILSRLLDQHFFRKVTHGADTPDLPAHPGQVLRFSFEWTTEAHDDQPHLQDVFRTTATVTDIKVAFDDAAADEQKWTYFTNGSPAPSECGSPEHSIFPRPHYVNVGAQLAPADRNILPDLFDAQLVDQGPPTAKLLEALSPIPAESMLLKLAGYGGNTRRSFGRGHDEPWPHPLASPGPALPEVEARFADLSRKLTDELRRWWREPSGVRFNIRAFGSPRLNSYAFTWEAKTPNGISLHGAGLKWFVTFMIEVLYARTLAAQPDQQNLFVFDEPGAPLHPAAQRAVVRLLDDLARSTRSQVIYSTHSPFMLDWSFPQRIRLFNRDFEGGLATIVNKPYSAGEFERVWDPLRETVGVTLGDVSLVGEQNVFVEGISDQIILASASECARRLGEPYLEFPRASIVPFGSDLPILERLLAEARRADCRSVVLVDADAQGKAVQRLCDRVGVATVSLDHFSDRGTGQPAAIEDVVGVGCYLPYVNRVYAKHEWFREIALSDVTLEGRSLGRWLEGHFAQRWTRTFGKVAVASDIAQEIELLGQEARQRLFALVGELAGVLGGRGHRA